MIQIIGNILGCSGYDIHTRELANALNKQTDVKLSSSIPNGAEHLITDEELKMLKKPLTKDAINLIITSPVYWKPHLTQKRNWVFLVWEGDKIPKSFLNECLNEKIEYIFVPSKHTKDALEKTWQEHVKSEIGKIKIKDWEINNIEVEPIKKVKIIPHGVDIEKFYPSPQRSTESPNSVGDFSEGKFTFLCNKGLRHLEDRGGVQYAVKAYLEEFTDEDVELILKINPAYGIPDLSKLLIPLKPKKEKLPKIKIVPTNLPYNKLMELYNQCDVFVMPTRAEAFGIPGIEAMACGKPVITTNFGGQIDYCNDKNSWIIDGELTEVTWELQYESIRWLSPSIEKLKKCMRDAYMDKKTCILKGQEALKTSKEYAWDNSAKKVADLI